MENCDMPNNYYFTFSASGNHAFVGGWVKVIAFGKADAIQTFLRHYPRKYGSALHCADLYTEEEFKKTGMMERGNFGKFQQGKTLFSLRLG